MDFYPENIVLEITALLNAPAPPGGPGADLERAGLAFLECQRIWWLEYFLQAGPEAFRDQFLSRPTEEQQALAVHVFRWFLFRPRLQRLYPVQSGFPAGTCWELERGGSLVSLAGEETHGPPAGVYYVFPHLQIWPDLLNRLNWAAFLPASERKDLEADLTWMSRSRLADVRDRSEQLRALLTGPGPERKLAETPQPEAPQPAAPVSPVKKTGRKKKTTDQLNLFD